MLNQDGEGKSIVIHKHLKMAMVLNMVHGFKILKKALIGNGRQIYKIDYGEHFSKIAKEYQQPHIHHFVWYYDNDGKWHYYNEVY